MAKEYTLKMESLTEEAFRKARATYIENEYKKRIAADSTTSRGSIMLQIALEIGVTQKCVWRVISESGMPTALPNYENCGNRAQGATSE